MKDSRAGETLWSEWSGNDPDFMLTSALVFYTQEHVDLDHEVVRRALASALQRDGSADSLGDAFKLLDPAIVHYGFAGIQDGDLDYTSCDANGMTFYDDKLDNVIPITWVEIEIG
jgi:hypothetical protein